MNPAEERRKLELALRRGKFREARTDPVMLAESGEFRCDPWQETVLRSQAQYIMLNCSRQSGKSTVVNWVALHPAVFSPASLTLIFAPTLRQSTELFRKVMQSFRALPEQMKILKLTETVVEFQNGARIVCLPEAEATIRGYSAPHTVIIDEAAFCSKTLYAAVRPMLAVSQGRLILVSSPNGRQGFFYEEWHNHRIPWERHTVTASACPRIPTAFLENEKQALGLLLYRQEYECEFMAAASGSVYAYDQTTNASPTLPTCTSFILGIDYGFNDECAFTVVGWNDDSPVVTILSSKKYAGMIPSKAAEHTRTLMSQYSFNRIVGDTGGLGKGYAEEARSRFGIPIEQAEKNNKRGYIDLFNDALRSQRLSVFAPNCADLTDEWQNLAWDEKREKELASAPNHCADSALYAWRATTGFCNAPIEPRPARGSQEYYDALEARIEASMCDDDTGDNLVLP